MLKSALALFIIFECFCAADQFNNGERLCRFLKYCMALISGILVMLTEYFGGQYLIDSLTLNEITNYSLLTTLALFLWPRMLARLGVYQRRIGD